MVGREDPIEPAARHDGAVYLRTSVASAGPEGTRKMVFTARVGWASLDELGPDFSGAPLFVDR